MPMSDRVRSRSPQADRELLEYIDRRRRVQARQRRQLIMLGTFAAVGLIGLTIAAASLLFYNRRPAAPAATVATAPPAQPPEASAVPSPTATPPTAPPEPAAPAASTDAAPSSTSAPPAVEPDRGLPPPSAGEPRPAVRESASKRRAAMRESSADPRSAVRESASAPRPAVRESTTESSAGTDPAQRTADWLVRTYGPLEAENRALVVAEFYSGERRAFWRRVAAGVRQTAER
jgi:hypothetical protein